MGFYLPSKPMAQELNDRLRVHGDQSIGKIVVHRHITALSGQEMMDIMKAVRTYNDWCEEKDPYGEHDYGSFEMNGETYIWKIEYYDPSYTYGVYESVRNNTKECKRLLTILPADQY